MNSNMQLMSFKANTFTSSLKINLFCEIGLWTLHNCVNSKSDLESNYRIPIPQFYVHWRIQNLNLSLTIIFLFHSFMFFGQFKI